MSKCEVQSTPERIQRAAANEVSSVCPNKSRIFGIYVCNFDFLI